VSPPSEVPQSPQKASSGSFAVPQLGQLTASAVPQREQNFRPGRFSVEQEGQVTSPSLGVNRPSFHTAGHGDQLAGDMAGELV
jgi:hypothetical protein